MFDSVEKVRQSLADQSYICDAKIATVVFLAHRLEKPVLVECPAGETLTYGDIASRIGAPAW